MRKPEELKYTEDHEWIDIQGSKATIGITDFASNELGDIVYVEIESLNENLDQGEIFGTIEAVKTVSDLFMPVTGEIVKVNEDLEDNPEFVNENPYDEGWMIEVKVEEVPDNLLSFDEYNALIGR